MTKYSSTGKTSKTLLKSLKEYYGGPAVGPDGKYDVHQKTFYINLLDLRNIYIILQKFFGLWRRYLKEEMSPRPETYTKTCGIFLASI